MVSEPLDLDALERDLHADGDHFGVEDAEALIAELRATRAERDDWRSTAANALKMHGAVIARAERAEAELGVCDDAYKFALRLSDQYYARAERAEAALYRFESCHIDHGCPCA